MRLLLILLCEALEIMIENLHAAPQKKIREITPDLLWEYTHQLDGEDMLKSVEFPIVDEGAYARVTLQKTPFEITVIKWPAKGKSAIHHHEGFFGAVKVVRGTLINRVFKSTNFSLMETSVVQFQAGGIVEEHDGVIHQLENPDDSPAISIHVYFPAIENFEGMTLFDAASGSMGVLGAQAKSASWKEGVEGHFARIQRGLLSFIPYEQLQKGSHIVYPIVPKPSEYAIDQLLKRYYDAQAVEYDSNEHQSSWRRAYTAGINRIVAHYVEQHDVQNYLALCTGTGRRPVRIQRMSGKEYHIYGVDISRNMCELATKRGLMVQCGSIDSEAITFDCKFDVITYLYALGHISNESTRVKVLKKVHSLLSPNGVFFADLFCLKNVHEWGLEIEKLHASYRLQDQGYERGDIFYKRADGEALAYLHYFTKEEVEQLFATAGFSKVLVRKVGYTVQSGELHDVQDEGMFWVEAHK